MIPINYKKNHKKLYVIIAILLVLLAGLFAYVYAFNGSIFGWKVRQTALEASSTDNNTPTEDQKKTGKQVNGNTVNSPDTTKPSTSGSGSDTPPAPVPQPDGKSIVEIGVTSTDQNDSNLRIRTVIYSVQGSGTCTITLTKPGSRAVTQTVDIQPLPTTSTCKGFDVPLSQLSAGEWKATLTFSNDTMTGTTIKTIAVQ